MLLLMSSQTEVIRRYASAAGPKISSREMRAFGATSSKTVGPTYADARLHLD